MHTLVNKIVPYYWYSSILIEVVSYILGEDCSHTTAIIYDVEGAINNIHRNTTNPCQ